MARSSTTTRYASDAVWEELDAARARIAELENAISSRAATLPTGEEALREALEAIIARGPERDVKWFGMTARDIAIHALTTKPAQS